MTPEQRVRRQVAEIAKRRRNTRIGEIDAVVNQLHKLGYSVSIDPFAHGFRYTIGDALPFTICTHRPGSSQLLAVYVDKFLDVMSELGFLEE